MLNLSQTFWFHRTFFKLYKEYEAYVIIRNFTEQSINDLMRPFNLFIQTKNIEHLFTLYTMTHNLDEIFEKENNDFITLFDCF
jgi:hypothetical protein